MTYGWTGALAVRGHRKRWVRAELAVSSKRTASVRGVPVPQGWLIGLCPVPLEGAVHWGCARCRWRVPFIGDEP